MSVTVFKGVPWGVEKYTLAGEGLTQPRLVSATPIDVNTVRVSFDRSMNFDFNPRSTGLKLTSWQVQKTSDWSDLGILRVTRISDTVVELMTIDQEAVGYQITCHSAEDVWDNPINPSYDTVAFTGIAPVYPSIDDVGSFIGMYSGMQHELNASITPDNDPPYLANLDPFSGETNVSILRNIILEIKDDGDGVDPDTVVITIEGTTAWIGDAAQPGFSVSKTILADGIRYTIDPTIPLPSGEIINIWVYAKDKSFFENTLNTSYNFITKVGAGPTVGNQLPAANSTQVPLDSIVSFYVTDSDDDLNASTVLITIDGVVAYSGLSEQNGYSVTRNSVPLGYSYTITPPLPFDYGAEIEVGVRADDYSAHTLQTTYVFYTVEDPLCFTGPLTDFEETLKDPIATPGAENIEQLRRWLLRNVLEVLQANRAIRFIYLRAYEHPVSSILNTVLVSPTSRERDVTLCRRRTNIEINTDLKKRPTLLDRAIEELTVLGATDQHVQILRAYAGTENPNDRIPIACIVTLLARILEDNELL